MDFQLEKQRLLLDQKIGRESSQLLLEGDLLAPDVKPDIAQILKIDARVNIERFDILTDRVSYSGKLEVNVLYLSKNSEKPVSYMTSSIAIDDFVNMDGLAEGMKADIDVEISHIDHRLVNDRKINIKAVLETNVTATAALEKEVVSGIGEIPESQVIISPFKISKIIEDTEEKFVIKEELAEPSGRPNIRELLNTRAELANKEVRAMDGKVSVKGDIVVKTLFLGDTEGNACEYMEHEVPFNGFIDAPHSQDGLFAEAALKVSDFYVQIRQDSDGEDRAIEVEASISARVKVYTDSSISMLEDAYSIDSSISLTKDRIKYPKVICRNKNQFPVRETVLLPESQPKIMQVYSIYGKNKIDRIEIEEEKVIVEGIIDLTLLYVDDSESRPLSSYCSVIPFRQVIDAKGACPDMAVSVDYSVAHSTFSMLSGNEIEARFVLDTTISVIDEKEVDLVTDVVVGEIDKEYLESIPSLVVYKVQKGDTLLGIAKKYNVSIDDIVSVNEITEERKVYPGQPLLVVKRRMVYESI